MTSPAKWLCYIFNLPSIPTQLSAHAAERLNGTVHHFSVHPDQELDSTISHSRAHSGQPEVAQPVEARIVPQDGTRFPDEDNYVSDDVADVKRAMGCKWKVHRVGCGKIVQLARLNG